MEKKARQIKIYSGFARKIARIPFGIRLLKYFIRRDKYPLFRIRRSDNGLLRSLRLEKELLLTKTISMNGAVYSGLSLPHYPSKAFDRAVSLGALNTCAVGTPLKVAIDNVIVAITSKCTYACKHCYEARNINQPTEIPLATWKRTIRSLQQLGVGIVILSGGEPMLRFYDLLDLLKSSDHDLSDFHLHTSGYGVTQERAEELRAAGLNCAAVGFDDVDPKRLATLRGNEKAFETAVHALRCFHDAGIFTYTNVCVTRELARSGDLWRYFDLVKDLGVGIVQLLEPRPCGGFGKSSMVELFDDFDRKLLLDFVRRGNTERRYRKHPLLYYLAHLERHEQIGCTMGGLTHFTIDSAGNVNPCVFVPVSFGNIQHEDLQKIVTRMRNAIPTPIHTTCPSIQLAQHTQRLNNQELQHTLPYETVRDVWPRFVD